jgi:hypothetical protein
MDFYKGSEIIQWGKIVCSTDRVWKNKILHAKKNVFTSGFCTL